MKVKHLLWLSLAAIWGKINWWAYTMLTTEDPNVIVDPMDTLAVLIFCVDVIVTAFFVFNFSTEIGDFWDKIKDKPIITPKKKDKLNLLDLAESDEEMELLKSIEKKIKKVKNGKNFNTFTNSVS